MNTVASSFILLFGVGRRRGGAGGTGPGEEDELPIADANLVTRFEPDRASQAAAVEEGTVLGGGVVQLARVVVMDQDGTVTAGNEGVRDDHVVIPGPAQGVEADFERVDEVPVHEPVF